MQRFKGQQVFNSLMKLAVDASHVVGLRMMKLVRGGRQARRSTDVPKLNRSAFAVLL